MAQRLAFDPNLQEAPDFASEAYADARARLTANGMSNADALAFLKDTWKQTHDALVAQWNAQVHADEVTREAEEALAREAEEAVQAAELAERLEAEKKKPKFPPLNANLCIEDVLTPQVSTQVTRKLAAHEYVPIYYFTAQGLEEAKSEFFNIDDDCLTITKHNGQLSVRNATTNKASKAINDRDLTFSEFSEAWPLMLETMKKCGWPKAHTNAHFTFFLALEHHEYRTREPRSVARAAIFQYAESVRRQWHFRLANTPPGEAPECFNLGIVNTKLLDQFYQRALDSLRKAEHDEVRFAALGHIFTC